ncbi:MAG: hypothetical protein M3P82_00395, partial [Bacteroidota bacterium]|nr:hypothetical protein [Bacteroidota bacterium]
GLTSYDVDFYKTVLKWAGHPSENVRRAVVFAAIGLRNKETISKAFSIFEILMYDRSKYVRKNLGPFILGSYFGNKFPEETLKYLRKWSKISDENVGWNVIMAFNNSFGNNHPQKAFWILRHFTGEVSPNIKRALKSTLNFLSRRHKQSVDEFKLKYNLNTADLVKS